MDEFDGKGEWKGGEKEEPIDGEDEEAGPRFAQAGGPQCAQQWNTEPKMVIHLDTPKYGDVMNEIHTDLRKIVSLSKSVQIFTTQ